MSEIHDTDCAAIREQLPDLAAGRLTREEGARVERHLPGCDDCRAELAVVRLVLESQPQVPPGLLEAITRRTASRRPARTWWGISAAAVAALALGIGITSEDPQPGADVPAFANEAAEGEIWLSDDGLLAGAPTLDDLSDEALLQLLDELTAGSTGGAA